MPIFHMEINLFSDLAEQARVREFVNEFAGTGGQSCVDDECSWQLELAVNEAVTNIIEHAYGGRKDGRIHIEADVFDDRIVINLFHWGAPFEPPEKITQPPLDGHRGFGLFMMKRCIDDIIYARHENGKNSIRFIKKL